MSVRELRVIEVRYAPSHRGPWSEIEIDELCAIGENEPLTGWCPPSQIVSGTRDGMWFQTRCIRYLPER